MYMWSQSVRIGKGWARAALGLLGWCCGCGFRLGLGLGLGPELRNQPSRSLAVGGSGLELGFECEARSVGVANHSCARVQEASGSA